MKVLNRYKDGIPKGAVDIRRGTQWGNHFVIGPDGDRDEVVDAHLAWARNKAKVDPEHFRPLHGKDLLCNCTPARCHGDNYVLICEELFGPTDPA